MTRTSGANEEVETRSGWDVPIDMAKALGATIGYLLIVAAMLSILEPEGLGWTLATAGAGMGIGTAALLLVKRVEKGLTSVFGRGTG
jgi:hypothetical protein